MLANGMTNVLSRGLGGQRARADSQATWDFLSGLNSLLKMSPEFEKVTIILPFSQPLPQTSDPVLSLSSTMVSSL